MKVLNYNGKINKEWDTDYYIDFGNNHRSICLDIAKKLKVGIHFPTADWRSLLEKLNFKLEDDDGYYDTYFPEFENVKELERFVLLINTDFLIDIQS